MPYVNIPDSNLSGAIAKLVGKIEGDVTGKVLAKANEIQTKFRIEGCPANVSRLRDQKNRLDSSSRKIDSRLNRFRKLPAALKIPLNGLKAAKKIILLLPIPQSVPPGFGIPVSITTKYADILHLLKEFIKQIGDDVNAIEYILKSSNGQLTSVTNILSRVESAIKSCEVEKSLREKLNSGQLTKQQLRQLGLLKGDDDFIFSTLGRQLVEVKPGRSVSDIAKDTGLSNEEVANQVKLNNFNNDNDRANAQLIDSIKKLDGSNLPISVKSELKNLLDTFKNVSEGNVSTDGRYFHTGPDGVVYELKIIVDPLSPKIAPRRFAVAIDPEGVQLYKGAKSFSSSIDVLLDEIKFRIDNQLS